MGENSRKMRKTEKEDVDKNKVIQHVPENVANKCLKTAGALLRPKGITKY